MMTFLVHRIRRVSRGRNILAPLRYLDMNSKTEEKRGVPRYWLERNGGVAGMVGEVTSRRDALT